MTARWLLKEQIEFWSRIFDFKGRTARKPFWIQIITATIINFALIFISVWVNDTAEFINSRIPEITFFTTVVSFCVSITSVAYFFGFLIASFSLQIRRLRDSQGSGWYIFSLLIPVAGSLLVLAWSLQSSADVSNNLHSHREPVRKSSRRQNNYNQIMQVEEEIRLTKARAEGQLQGLIWAGYSIADFYEKICQYMSLKGTSPLRDKSISDAEKESYRIIIDQVSLIQELMELGAKMFDDLGVSNEQHQALAKRLGRQPSQKEYLLFCAEEVMKKTWKTNSEFQDELIALRERTKDR